MVALGGTASKEAGATGRVQNEGQTGGEEGEGGCDSTCTPPGRTREG